MNERIDVLAVMDAVSSGIHYPEEGLISITHHELYAFLEARAAVAELIEAAKLANGDHTAPHDCYATGPLTGDAYLDLVRCPGCQLSAALARVRGSHE